MRSKEAIEKYMKMKKDRLLGIKPEQSNTTPITINEILPIRPQPIGKLYKVIDDLSYNGIELRPGKLVWTDGVLVLLDGVPTKHKKAITNCNYLKDIARVDYSIMIQEEMNDSSMNGSSMNKWFTLKR